MSHLQSFLVELADRDVPLRVLEDALERAVERDTSGPVPLHHPLAGWAYDLAGRIVDP